MPGPYADLPQPTWGSSGGQSQGGGWSSAGAGIGGGLASLFGMGGNQKWSNPSDAASPYLQQIPGTVSPYYNPYIQAGQRSLGKLEGEYGSMMSDPGALIRKLSEGFQKSPGYDFAKSEALGAANRASAAGGMLGSMQEQQNIGNITEQLANRDFESYLQHALDTHGGGMQGLSHINDMGFQGSDSLAHMLMEALTSQASNAYSGAENKNQNELRRSNNKSSLWGSLGSLGGGILGGPIGQKAGGWLGGLFD